MVMWLIALREVEGMRLGRCGPYSMDLVGCTHGRPRLEKGKSGGGRFCANKQTSIVLYSIAPIGM
jgi:hypothetical protein